MGIVKIANDSTCYPHDSICYPSADMGTVKIADDSIYYPSNSELTLSDPITNFLCGCLPLLMPYWLVYILHVEDRFINTLRL
jgi:hypothetical protein